VDVAARVTEVLAPHPDVRRVELAGSRARGEVTALSDWDFHLDAHNGAQLARDLPDLVAPLAPLAGQWDRLTERATSPETSAAGSSRRARARLDARWRMAVPRRLGDEVAAALRSHGLA
jgi:predicted nucleotidyltransferase